MFQLEGYKRIFYRSSDNSAWWPLCGIQCCWVAEWRIEAHESSRRRPSAITVVPAKGARQGAGRGVAGGEV